MKIPVHDIEDAQSFVTQVIHRKFSKVSWDDRDELVAEGLVILFDLAKRYDPAKEGGKKDHVCKGAKCCVPSFAGYASFQLPLKLLDAWHAMHPEHVRMTLEDGSRKYKYLEPAIGMEHSDDTYFDYHPGTGGDVRVAAFDRETTRHVGNFIAVPEAV